MHFEWMVDEGGMLISGNALMPDKTVALVNVAEKGYLTLTLSATGQGGRVGGDASAGGVAGQ